MNFDCIVSQGHIPTQDLQGNLSAEQKLELSNMSLRHLRENNPNSYIILSGHGELRPDLTLCDWYYWEDKCRPIDDSGYPIGIPAQFPFVDIGFIQAEKMGFTHCLKTRTDCIIQRSNITEWCQEILEQENKPIFLTQQTGNGYIGDCFMYGNVNDLHTIWNSNNPVMHPGGLINTAAHIRKAFPWMAGDNWRTYLRRYAAFRDVIDIPFLCLRWNYHKMKQNGDWDKIMDGQLDINEYHWGKFNGWHAFDADGNMIKTYTQDFWSKKFFYHE